MNEIYDKILYIYKLMIMFTIYLCFVKATSSRSEKMKEQQDKEPIKFLGIHIDLYVLLFPVYVILIMAIF